MTFPSSDVFLRHVVTSEVDDVRRNGGTLGHARRNLRALFPHIDLLRQRAVRIGNQPTEVWFAFRDGRKAAPCHRDMWWTGPGTASSA